MSRRDWEKAKRKEAARSEPIPDSAVWWWVPNGGRCSRCREYGDPIAYNHPLQARLCGICVDAWGITPRKSKRFMASEKSTPKKKRKGGRHVR